MRTSYLVTLALATALAVGALLPPDPSAAGRSAAEIDWQLLEPAQLLRFESADFQAAVKLSWGSGQTPSGLSESDGQPKDVAWHFRGTSEGDQKKALVQLEGGPVAEVAIGDTLPDGSTLKSLSHSSIETHRDGCTAVRELYRSDTPPKAGLDGCAEQESN